MDLPRELQTARAAFVQAQKERTKRARLYNRFFLALAIAIVGAPFIWGGLFSYTHMIVAVALGSYLHIAFLRKYPEDHVIKRSQEVFREHGLDLSRGLNGETTVIRLR